MEAKKKLKMPSGNVHDIRYLYTTIASLKRRAGRTRSGAETLRYFRRMINDYNDAKSARFGLSFKPREVNLKVVEHVVAELRNLGLIQEQNEYLTLTNEGELVATLIEQRDSEELKRLFAKLMLQNYLVFEYFLKRIKQVSAGEGVPIPFITSRVFDKFVGDAERIGRRYIHLINERCSNLLREPSRLYDLLGEEKIDTIEKRTHRIRKLQTVIQKYVISEVFQPHIRSRRVYDFVRSRMTFLGLTNYATFEFGELPAEVTYLTSSFGPTFPHSVKSIEYSDGVVYANSPSYGELRDSFWKALIKIYKAKRDEFRYMKVADARDAVCRGLKISDDLFDLYIKRLYEDEPHRLSFTYAGARDKITEKRLPILFKRPRELYTLLKVNLGG